MSTLKINIFMGTFTGDYIAPQENTDYFQDKTGYTPPNSGQIVLLHS
jgi:hypothetical protein